MTEVVASSSSSSPLETELLDLKDGLIFTPENFIEMFKELMFRKVKVPVVYRQCNYKMDRQVLKRRENTIIIKAKRTNLSNSGIITHKDMQPITIQDIVEILGAGSDSTLELYSDKTLYPPAYQRQPSTFELNSEKVKFANQFIPRALLENASEVLRNMLCHESFKTSKLIEEDCKNEVAIDFIVNYLHGKWKASNLTLNDVIDVIVIADKYQIKTLIHECQKILSSKHFLTIENFQLILELAQKHNFELLLNNCKSFSKSKHVLAHFMKALGNVDLVSGMIGFTKKFNDENADKTKVESLDESKNEKRVKKRKEVS